MSRKEFYHSKAWKLVKNTYALSKNMLCERCGRAVYIDGLSSYQPKDKRLIAIVHHKEYLNESNYIDDAIALNEDNLELLCIECHDTEHNFKGLKKEYKFDELGNLKRIG